MLSGRNAVKIFEEPAMKVKICGMREASNIADTALLHPDFMGFIFYMPSPRNCIGMRPEILSSLPDDIEPVMVSVDMTEDELLGIAYNYKFHTVQLHGNESPDMCRRLRGKGLTVIKALGIDSKESLESIRKYEEAANILLLDTSTPSKGGSGKKFDWSILDGYDSDTPFILSGGIGPDDAESILSFKHPKFAGIDLNSRFESSPGIKDTASLNRFLTELNKTV